MKRYIVAAFFIVFCGGASARSSLAVDGSISTGVDSQYLPRPGFVAYNKPISWTSVYLEHGGWYGNIWGSLGIDSERETYGDEVDLTLGKKFGVAGCAVDLSGSYFIFSKFKDFGDDLWVFDGRVDLPNKIPWATPWMAIRYFGSTGSEGSRSGWFGWVGVSRNQPLGFVLPTQKEELALNLDAQAAFSFGGAFGGAAGPVYARLNASTSFDLPFGIQFNPYVMWQVPIQDESHYVDGRHHVVYGASVTYSF